ncbi:MAG: hypothetical protein HY858_09330 [Candidatus Solibacter usitatus]|nr:hypothetical protein [Candidatus Solibacter usitatus]
MIVLAGRVLLALAVSVALAAAQDTVLRGPLSGLLVDPAGRSLRAIVGMPGAAYAGDPSVSGVDFASAAPNGETALVSRNGGVSIVHALQTGTPAWLELSGQTPGISLAAWSGSADSLALLDSAARRLDLWSNLSAEPARLGSVDLTAISDPVVSLAVLPDGLHAFAAVQGETSAALYLLTPGETPRLLVPLARAGALLLSGGELFAADLGRNEVLRIANWDRNPSVTAAAPSGLGLDGPVGIALSADRSLLYVANARSRQVLTVDLASASVRNTLDLDFIPTRLERLGPGSLYLLDRGVAGAQPAQLLDTAAQRVWFVPVSRSSDPAAAPAPSPVQR